MAHVRVLFVFLGVALGLTGTQGAFAASPAETAIGRPIRFLLPPAPFSGDADKELLKLIERYNKTHPQSPVELIQRGENFSSIKELITLSLASDPPEIAAIELSEYPAIQSLNLAKAVRIKSLKTAPNQRFYPFRLTVPIVVADQEMLFRGRANPDQLPTEWKGLTALAQSLARALHASSPQALSVPLQGPTGLWIFEALLGKPLWAPEAHPAPPSSPTVGEPWLRNDPEVPRAIEEIQRMIDTPHLLKAEENAERATQLFLERKSPLLIASLDMLPYISRQATFRWMAAPLPNRNGKSSLLQTGNALVITRNSPEVLNFLEYLYNPAHAIHLAAAGSFLPLDSKWLTRSEWKEATRSHETYQRLVSQLFQNQGRENRGKPPQSRATCREVVRTRSEWAQSLRLFFGDPSRRLPSARILKQLEEHMNMGSPR